MAQTKTALRKYNNTAVRDIEDGNACRNGCLRACMRAAVQGCRHLQRMRLQVFFTAIFIFTRLGINSTPSGAPAEAPPPAFRVK